MAEVIPHWLTKQAYLAPNKVAIETELGDSITFKELKERSQSYAKKLAKFGVKEGDRIGILSSNQVSMVIAIHALSYLGALSVMLNTRLTKLELAYQMKDAEVSVMLTCDQLQSNVEQMEFPIPTKAFSEIDKLTEELITLRTEMMLDDVFTIIYTSGTTGSPKGVIHTYGNHWWSAIGSALNLGLNTKDKWLAMLPIFHISGLSIFIRSVIYGMTVYLVEQFDETVVNKAIMNEKVTIVSVVTVMLQRLVNDLGENRYPTSFRCMLLGGGPAPKPLLEKSQKHNIPVFQSYGMTETSSQIVTLSPNDALHKLGSAGKPLFPGQLKISNKEANLVGEIWVKGPMVTKGYYNNDKANSVAFQDGWLGTGDLGYLDVEGYLYVVDRRNDLIISGGENIYPSEVESALAGMKQIDDIGVVGKKHDTWGEIPVAFVVIKSDAVTITEIQTYAKERLASYKVPKEIYFVDYLPRNAAKKLVRQDLQQWIETKKSDD